MLGDRGRGEYHILHRRHIQDAYAVRDVPGIQLGTPFYITIEGEAKLGGFWNLDLVNITVVARGSGVSEHYWK